MLPNQALSESDLQGPPAASRVEMHEPRTLSERIADGASAGIGSWRFIIIQTIMVIIWVALNVSAWRFKWDPYPFILLNLMFSVQAAYTGPILLLAGNRQAAKDRAMAERDDHELGLLLRMQREQMDALRLLKDTQSSQTELLRLLQEHMVKSNQHMEAVNDFITGKVPSRP